MAFEARFDNRERRRACRAVQPKALSHSPNHNGNLVNRISCLEHGLPGSTLNVLHPGCGRSQEAGIPGPQLASIFQVPWLPAKSSIVGSFGGRVRFARINSASKLVRSCGLRWRVGKRRSAVNLSVFRSLSSSAQARRPVSEFFRKFDSGRGAGPPDPRRTPTSGSSNDRERWWPFLSAGVNGSRSSRFRFVKQPGWGLSDGGFFRKFNSGHRVLDQLQASVLRRGVGAPACAGPLVPLLKVAWLPDRQVSSTGVSGSRSCRFRILAGFGRRLGRYWPGCY